MSFLNNALKIVKNGIIVTTTASSASQAIPTNASGNTSNLIRVSCPNSTAYAYVMPGNSSVVASTASIAIGGFGDILLDVSGCTHIAYIQGSASAILNIIPVEA